MKKLILIDGNSVAFRAFYGLPLLSNQSGLHTNAIFGYARLLEKLIADEAPTHFLVAFDAGKSTFRHKQYEEYKGGQTEMKHGTRQDDSTLKELRHNGTAIGTARLEQVQLQHRGLSSTDCNLTVKLPSLVKNSPEMC